VNGKRYGLLSRWVIPKNVEEVYCNNDFVLVDNGTVLDVIYTGICALCERRYEEATKPHPVVCHNFQINKAIGHVVPICIDCNYYLMYIDGYDAVPKQILQKIKSGFVPKKLDAYL
jgi:hypothetical protein